MADKRAKASEAGKASAEARRTKGKRKLNVRSTSVQRPFNDGATTNTNTNTNTNTSIQEPNDLELSEDPQVIPAATPGKLQRGTIEELAAFAVEIGQPASDGEACFYGWQANGWTLSGKAIKDWKAAMRNWKLRGWLASQKARANGHNGNPPTPRPLASYEPTANTEHF
jgi:hypothetical protein